MFVISGPSGVGKGTVVRRVLQLKPDLVMSISYTTRTPRPGEVDGRDYRFVSAGEFDRLIAEDAFLEWAEIYGRHRYGTLLAPVARSMDACRDVVLEVDIQGAGAVRSRMPDATLIFLQPPSFDALAERLEGRATEDDAQMSRRIAAAEHEMAQATWFDHVVVNDEIERAAARVAAIIGGSDPGD